MACFALLFSAISGGDMEMVQSPFAERPLHRWPWDIYAVLNFKKMQTSIDREIDFRKQFPAPTKRTRRSHAGMEEWRRWCDREEKEMQKAREHTKDGKKPTPRSWEKVFHPSYFTVFDHLTQGYLLLQHTKTGELRSPKEFNHGRLQQQRQKQNPISAKNRRDPRAMRGRDMRRFNNDPVDGLDIEEPMVETQTAADEN